MASNPRFVTGRLTVKSVVSHPHRQVGKLKDTGSPSFFVFISRCFLRVMQPSKYYLTSLVLRSNENAAPSQRYGGAKMTAQLGIVGELQHVAVTTARNTNLVLVIEHSFYCLNPLQKALGPIFVQFLGWRTPFYRLADRTKQSVASELCFKSPIKGPCRHLHIRNLQFINRVLKL